MVKTTASKAMYDDVRKAEKATGLKIEKIEAVMVDCIDGQWGLWKIMRCYRSGKNYIADVRIIQECDSEQEANGEADKMRASAEEEEGFSTMNLGVEEIKEDYRKVEYDIKIIQQVKVDKDYYDYWEKVKILFGLLGEEDEYPMPVCLNIDGQYGVWKILGIYLEDEDYIAEYGLIDEAEDGDEANEKWRKRLSEMIRSTENTTEN